MHARKSLSVLLLIVVLALTLPPRAGADVIVVQPGPDTGQDAFVEALAPDAQQGNNNWLCFGGTGGSGEKRLYIRFPLPEVAPGARIDSVSLEFYMYARDGFFGIYTYGLYPVTEPWDEGTITWNTQPSTGSTPVATFSGEAWEADYPAWHAVADPALVPLVQQWLDDPASNNGVMIAPVASFYGAPLLWSSEYVDDPSLRPRLVLTGDLVASDTPCWGAVKRLYR